MEIAKKDVDKPTGICYYTQAGGNAGVAQSVEQLICNQQVGGSSPSTSSNTERKREYGGIPEWPKGTDCKSAGNAFGGSNPPSPTMCVSEAKIFRFRSFLPIKGHILVKKVHPFKTCYNKYHTILTIQNWTKPDKKGHILLSKCCQTFSRICLNILKTGKNQAEIT